MNREEEIRQAALKYSFDTDGGVTGDLNTGRDDFTEGALWSDSHPKSPWHSVADGDLPKEPKGNEHDLPFLTQFEDDIILSYYAADEDNPDVFDFYDECGCALSVNYWMEIPKLPNK